MSALSSALLSTRGLRAGYGDVEIIHDVDLHIGAGEIVTIIGPERGRQVHLAQGDLRRDPPHARHGPLP